MSHRILVVDDDIDYLTQMRIQLEAAGFEVVTAENPDEAQHWLNEHEPDAAIIDLMMENYDDGFTLCHAIKEKRPNLPVLMVTAVAAETGITFDASTKKEKAWIKADAVLNKPVRFEQLKRELDRLLKD